MNHDRVINIPHNLLEKGPLVPGVNLDSSAVLSAGHQQIARMLRLSRISAELTKTKFTPEEKRWFELFANNIFRINAFITEGADNYQIGQVAYGYGNSEASFYHGRGGINKKTTWDQVDAFDQQMMTMLETGFLMPEQGAFDRGVLPGIHLARRRVLQRGVMTDFVQEHPMHSMGYPIYLLARDKAQRVTDPDYDKLEPGTTVDFVGEEHERALVNGIYSEASPHDFSLASLPMRRMWSNLVTIMADDALVVRAGHSLNFGNFLSGEVTGIESYTERTFAGRRLKLADFVPDDRGIAPIYEEATPKSVNSSFAKVLKSEQSARTLEHLSRKYRPDLTERGYPYDQMYYERLPYVAIRERVRLLAHLFQTFMEGGGGAEMSTFMYDVAQRYMNLEDMFRLRAYFADGELDRYCEDALLGQGVDAKVMFYITTQVTPSGILLPKPQTLIDLVPLKEVLKQHGSVEKVMSKWVERGKEPYVESVFTSVFIHDTVCVEGIQNPVPAEAQLFTLQSGQAAWDARQNLKLQPLK